MENRISFRLGLIFLLQSVYDACMATMPNQTIAWQGKTTMEQVVPFFYFNMESTLKQDITVSILNGSNRAPHRKDGENFRAQANASAG